MCRFLGSRSIITLCEHPTSVSDWNQFSTAARRTCLEGLVFKPQGKERERGKKKRLEKWFSFWWPPASILQQNNESASYQSTHLQCLLRPFVVSLPIIAQDAGLQQLWRVWDDIRPENEWFHRASVFLGAERLCNNTQGCWLDCHGMHTSLWLRVFL